jgi:hypothetical protein
VIGNHDAAARLRAYLNSVETKLAEDPKIRIIVKLPEEYEYRVKYESSNIWTAVSVRRSEQTGDYELAKKDLSNTEWSRMGKYIVVTSSGKVSKEMLSFADKVPPEAVRTCLRSGKTTIEAHKNPTSGDIYLEFQQLPPHLRSDPAQLPAIMRNGDCTSALQLQRDISRLDRQLKSGHYDQASGQVNNLIEIHGRRPELTLRKGLIQISQQASKLAPIITETIRSTGLRNPNALINELNARIAQSGIAPNGEKVEFTKEGKRIGVNYHLGRALEGETINPKEIKAGTPQVYVQDHPGLNHINWNVSLKKGMVTAVSHNLGTVIRLRPGPIIDFNPTTILASNHTSGETIQYRLVRPGRTPKGSGARPRCPERVIEIGGDDTRVIGGSDPCGGPVIYVVRANGLH